MPPYRAQRQRIGRVELGARLLDAVEQAARHLAIHPQGGIVVIAGRPGPALAGGIPFVHRDLADEGIKGLYGAGELHAVLVHDRALDRPIQMFPKFGRPVLEIPSRLTRKRCIGNLRIRVIVVALRADHSAASAGTGRQQQTVVVADFLAEFVCPDDPIGQGFNRYLRFRLPDRDRWPAGLLHCAVGIPGPLIRFATSDIASR
ncbi:hypothetical protein G6F65_019563 [Rhizopus arrhizus]|nr:hypothetical protein G6F65_019563 [Rhizopus arrhizus]